MYVRVCAHVHAFARVASYAFADAHVCSFLERRLSMIRTQDANHFISISGTVVRSCQVKACPCLHMPEQHMLLPAFLPRLSLAPAPSAPPRSPPLRSPPFRLRLPQHATTDSSAAATTQMLEAARDVKCTKCAHQWTIYADTELRNNPMPTPTHCPAPEIECKSTTFEVPCPFA